MSTRTRNALGLLALLVAVIACALLWRREPKASVTTHAFHGIVRDRTHAIAAASVRALWIQGDDAPRALGQATTNREGAYELEVSAPPGAGLLVLEAEASSYARTGRRVELGTAQQDFLLLPGGVRVTTLVVDGSDQPVEGAEVVVAFEALAAAPDAVTLFTATSDAQGRAVAENVPQAPGRLHWSVTANGRERAMGTVAKELGGADVAITARLSEGLTLSARVRDRSGKPVSGVTVRVSEAAGPWVVKAVSSADGIVVRGAPHDADLAVALEGDWVLADGHDSVAVARTQTAPIELVVEPAGAIVGVVRDGAAAVGGAEIVAVPSDTQTGAARQATTTPDGHFALRGLRPGTTWNLDVRHPEHAPYFGDAVRTGTDPLTIVLHTGGTLEGRVTDGKAPAAGVEVYAHRVKKSGKELVGSREHATMKTGDDGRFALRHLGAGEWRFEVRSPVRMAWSPTATIARSEEVADDRTVKLGDLVVPRGGKLRVEARASDGAPPSRIWLSFVKSGQGGAPHRVQVQQTGAGVFELEGLAPGTYDLAALAPELGHAHAAAVKIDADAVARAEVVFAGTAVIEGVVTDAVGVPVAGAIVDAYREGAGSQATHSIAGRAPDNFTGNTARTDEAGRFRLTGLEGASHKIRIEKEGEAPLETALTPGSKAKLRMPRGATLDVQVPAQNVNAVVSIESSGHHAGAVVGPDRIAHFTGLPAGSYRVRAVAPGLKDSIVALGEGAAERVTLLENAP